MSEHQYEVGDRVKMGPESEYLKMRGVLKLGSPGTIEHVDSGTPWPISVHFDGLDHMTYRVAEYEIEPIEGEEQ
jgi:hypothetical protein